MISIRNKALQHLARRDHSRAELTQKLLRFDETYDAAEVDAVLDDFIERGWLSDARFAEQWVHFRSQRYGSQRLRHELREKGVDQDIIEEVLAQYSDLEESQARLVWQKKFSSAAQDQKERGKQLRFLASRGFSLSVIYRIVAQEDEGF